VARRAIQPSVVSLSRAASEDGTAAAANSLIVESNGGGSLPVSRQSSLQQDEEPPARHSGGMTANHSSSSGASPASASASSSAEEEEISAEHVRASMVTAVEERVRQRLCEETSRTSAEIDSLGSTCKELTEGRDHLAAALFEMAEAEKALDVHMDALRSRGAALEVELRRLDELEQCPLEPDDAVAAVEADGAKMAETLADDHAVDDAIYLLGRALHEGAVECGEYLKRVRGLSREQFRHRATMFVLEERLKRQQRLQEFQQQQQQPQQSDEDCGVHMKT